MVNQPPHHIMFSKERVIEYGESLNKVVAWAYFNRLLTAETHLHSNQPKYRPTDFT